MKQRQKTLTTDEFIDLLAGELTSPELWHILESQGVDQ